MLRLCHFYKPPLAGGLFPTAFLRFNVKEVSVVCGPVAADEGGGGCVLWEHCKSELPLLWLSSDRRLCQPADVPLSAAAV